MNTNNNMARIVVIIVVLAVIVGVVVVLMNNKASNNTAINTTPSTGNTPNTTTTPENGAANNQGESKTSTDQTTPAIITYRNGSFSPAQVIAKSGGTVKVVNESSEKIYFASDPHPVHTANTELNIGDIEAGQSKTITVTNKGTWGYHDHYKPEIRGKIIVE
jgi:plastocyanin